MFNYSTIYEFIALDELANYASKLFVLMIAFHGLL